MRFYINLMSQPSENSKNKPKSFENVGVEWLKKH
jgi:hypothetical protein